MLRLSDADLNFAFAALLNGYSDKRILDSIASKRSELTVEQQFMLDRALSRRSATERDYQQAYDLGAKTLQKNSVSVAKPFVRKRLSDCISSRSDRFRCSLQSLLNSALPRQKIRSASDSGVGYQAGWLSGLFLCHEREPSGFHGRLVRRLGGDRRSRALSPPDPDFSMTS